jgi:uncharacterized damage-inducible protein DinB
MPASPSEPWLRATHLEIPPIPRAVIHALELAEEDLLHWCASLTAPQLDAHPAGLPSITFHIRHIARSIDRLLTYGEARQLSEPQLQQLRTESAHLASSEELFAELHTALAASFPRIRALGEQHVTLLEIRHVGRRQLPTTVAGLLIHIADHTQRHVGQAITTAKILAARRE